MRRIRPLLRLDMDDDIDDVESGGKDRVLVARVRRNAEGVLGIGQDLGNRVHESGRGNGRAADGIHIVVQRIRIGSDADELIHGETAAERFVSDAAAQFCAGIWLEHYVFSMLKKFKFDRKRALMNAKVIDAKKNRNEIDSIVIHGNTCYLIEDKTKNMDVKNGDRGNIADNAVYKLSQLTKSMGLRTKGILVSARAVRPVDKERARAYGVEIIDWLPDLEPRLKNILGL